jgi:hypothetical protein
MLCCIVWTYWHFGWTCFLHLQRTQNTLNFCRFVQCYIPLRTENLVVCFRLCSPSLHTFMFGLPILLLCACVCTWTTTTTTTTTTLMKMIND